MSKESRRSDCPIHVALNLLGDRWTLVVVRDLLLRSGATFGELLDAPESIATNTLSSRLASLQAAGIVEQLPNDKRYLLTEIGLDLIPVLFELTLWSVRHQPDVEAPPIDFIQYQADPKKYVEQVKMAARKKRHED